MDLPDDPLPSVLVNNVVSIEAAVWEETFWDEEPIDYTGTSGNERRYEVDDLKMHSWSFWFNQRRHPVRHVANRLVNSRISQDAALEAMRLNDFSMRTEEHFRRLLFFEPHYYRVPVPDSLPLEGEGTPDLASEIPALLSPPSRYPDYLFVDLTAPLGEAINLAGTDLFAEDVGWMRDEHSAFLDVAYPLIDEWYERLFAPLQILPREEE
jgi:hypothetical protein